MKDFSKDDVELLNALLAQLVRKSKYYNAPKPKVRRRDVVEQPKADALTTLLTGFADKYAEDASTTSPSNDELRRMYNVIQADANLTKRVAGLGFGTSGDAYRKAALKLRIMALMNVLRDGKNIRNDIVHKPGYIPSEASTARALNEYAQADKGISEFLARRA